MTRGIRPAGRSIGRRSPAVTATTGAPSTARGSRAPRPAPSTAARNATVTSTAIGARRREGRSAVTRRRDPHPQPIADVVERGRKAVEQGAGGTHDHQGRQDRHLRRELGRLRGDQERGQHADRDAMTDPTDATGGDRARVGDHEEAEHQDLRRRHQHPPVRPAAHRRHVPAGRHAVTTRREHTRPGGERDPERGGDGEQALPPRDDEATDEDDDQRGHDAR